MRSARTDFEEGGWHRKILTFHINSSRSLALRRRLGAGHQPFPSTVRCLSTKKETREACRCLWMIGLERVLAKVVTPAWLPDESHWNTVNHMGRGVVPRWKEMLLLWPVSARRARRWMSLRYLNEAKCFYLKSMKGPFTLYTYKYTQVSTYRGVYFVQLFDFPSIW